MDQQRDREIAKDAGQQAGSTADEAVAGRGGSPTRIGSGHG